MKYFALIGLLITLAVLALGVRLATEAPQDLRAENAQTRRVQGDPAAIARDILRVRQLDSQLDTIEARAFGSSSDTALIAYSRAPAIDPTLQTRLKDENSKSEPKRARVSLLYSGQDFNRAVVDGKYVRAGDRLPGGGRVLKISENSVLIRTGRHHHRLHVPDSRRIAKSGH